MKIETIVVGPFEVNCCLAWDEASRQALVVDPGADAEEVADYLSRAGLNVAGYLLTHGHVDHVSALADLADKFPAPAVMHPDDVRWAFDKVNGIEPYYRPPRRPSVAPVFPEDMRLTLGPWEGRIIHTPGHSPGSVCYYFPAQNVMFTGDTLFQGTVGRTDLPGGDTRTLADSLRRLRGLPEATRIYPGHGPDSTLAEEYISNPFLTG